MSLYEMLRGRRLLEIFEGDDPQKIRGITDEKLKFMPTSNLCCVALARLMEAQGVDDQPLIDELYKRGGAKKEDEKV